MEKLKTLKEKLKKTQEKAEKLIVQQSTLMVLICRKFAEKNPELNVQF